MHQAHRAGVGLRSMRERAEELGGMCVVESNERKGTCVSVSFPLVTV
jgi:signal transduction histidine kinase